MALENQTAIITGASRGIGLAIAEQLAQAGVNLILNARHPIPDTVLERLTINAHKPLVVVGDIAEEATGTQLRDLAQTTYGRIDILVNNAGMTKDLLAIRMSPADFAEVINVNLNGTFAITQPIFKTMLKQRAGVIINLASVVGITGNIGQANYAASKAGVIGLTKTLAKEGAMRGVRVNALAPGMIATDMTEALGDKAKEAILSQIPLKRFGQAEEVAQAALFLIQNDYITGQTLSIDGGLA